MASASETDFDAEYWNRMANNDTFLGRGALGDVYGPIPWHNKSCALKKILFREDKQEEVKKEIENNKRSWLSLKHKNLMTVYGVHLQPKALYVVMEFAAGRSLDQVLQKYASELKLMIDIVTDWAKQLADGMAYLHEINIVHRDLKSANIVLMEQFHLENAHAPNTLKITDLDTIKELHHTTTLSLKGTVASMAPEVLAEGRFSQKSDAWSYGVVIWEMLTGYPPHKGLQEQAIMMKAMAGKLDLGIPQSIPEAYKELLQSCINKNKDNRPSFHQIVNWFGRATFNSETDSISCQTIRTKAAVEQNKAITGMTILDKELFIVSRLSSEVEVYDSTKLSFSRRWELAELVAPVDIGSCKRMKCLYIMHEKGSGQTTEIIRVDRNGVLSKRWPTGQDYGYGISVTDESNIIVCVFQKNKVTEYSPEGHLIRVVESGLVHPSHALKLINGQFLVSHGTRNDISHRVCIVDSDEKIKKSFSGKNGSVTSGLNRPAHLAVDGSGLWMVVDQWNSRVLSLDSNLKFIREVLSKERHGLRRPSRILLDESNGRLLVTDNEWDTTNLILNDGRSLIFNHN